MLVRVTLSFARTGKIGFWCLRQWPCSCLWDTDTFYFDSARQKDSGNKIGRVPTQHTALWNLVPLLCEAASIQNDFHVIVCFNCLLYLFIFGETWVWHKLFFPSNRMLHSVGVWIYSLRDCSWLCQLFLFTDISVYYFVNYKIPG